MKKVQTSATSEYRQLLVRQRCGGNTESSYTESSSAPTSTARVKNVYEGSASTSCTTQLGSKLKTQENAHIL
jgi:hypothetical protein